MVDVGGYRLFLHCEGTGSPTVVFENGFERDRIGLGHGPPVFRQAAADLFL